MDDEQMPSPDHVRLVHNARDGRPTRRFGARPRAGAPGSLRREEPCRGDAACLRSDWADFRAWCERYDRTALPADTETVGLYLGSTADRFSLATLERTLAALSTLPKEAGFESPASVSQGPLRKIWKGIVREKTRRQDKAEPLLVEDLRRLIEHLPRDRRTGELTPASLRDRALLLVGWAGALRRTELVALTTADVSFVAGQGFSAHPLRSGFITQAVRAGKPERRVKEHSGHKSWKTFNAYVKQAGTFQQNPVGDIGL